MNMENEIRLQKNTKFQQKFHQMYFLKTANTRSHSLYLCYLNTTLLIHSNYHKEANEPEGV